MKYLLRALAGVPICLLISQPAISLVDEEIAATISIACERLLADYF